MTPSGLAALKGAVHSAPAGQVVYQRAMRSFAPEGLWGAKSNLADRGQWGAWEIRLGNYKSGVKCAKT